MPSPCGNISDSERMNRCCQKPLIPINRCCNRISNVDLQDSFFIPQNNGNLVRNPDENGIELLGGQFLGPNEPKFATFVVHNIERYQERELIYSDQSAMPPQEYVIPVNIIDNSFDFIYFELSGPFTRKGTPIKPIFMIGFPLWQLSRPEEKVSLNMRRDLRR
ncbi:MAG: hypothetical protein Hyperionvirus3_81 [Hyperionvirus sp.]|uniref:Uncharacterized protein n=1 Tax=Hyperionvirus sp. TaxID=2487770 RepID=A0A3G5A6R9_9VIRU|nr:MAG: hypothetical protein Hyperionvirus3_81 [Hyperionvirus sp.]